LVCLEQVEVPLLYYFPGADSAQTSAKDKARAFVYEVRDDPRDATRQIIEIVVDGGRDFMLSELRVDVDNDRLVISGERSSKTSRRSGSRSSLNNDDKGSDDDDDNGRQMIKQYTLPARSDVASITARRSDDGRLSILVPVRR